MRLCPRVWLLVSLHLLMTLGAGGLSVGYYAAYKGRIGRVCLLAFVNGLSRVCHLAVAGDDTLPSGAPTLGLLLSPHRRSDTIERFRTLEEQQRLSSRGGGSVWLSCYTAVPTAAPSSRLLTPAIATRTTAAGHSTTHSTSARRATKGVCSKRLLFLTCFSHTLQQRLLSCWVCLAIALCSTLQECLYLFVTRAATSARTPPSLLCHRPCGCYPAAGTATAAPTY